MYLSATVRTKPGEEKKMAKTSFPGSRIGVPLFFVLALSVCSAFSSYRLKKSAEIKRWEKNLTVYSANLSMENAAAKEGR